MADYTLEAELREKTGRSEARRLRRTGRIPAIIYGGDKPDLPITLDYLDTSKKLEIEHFHTTMIEVNVDGARGKNTVLLKDVQWDPIRDTATHIDFYRVSSSDTVSVEVPIVAVNSEKCPGVVQGGLVSLVRHSLEVTSRADAIPEHIEIDCSELDIGDSIHIEDIALPEGAEVLHDVNFTVLNLSAPTKAEPEPEVEEAVEEGEGEAEAAEEPTEESGE
ncbi:MAG: 50S ribosomal protein L25/general stress protein Ctc [Mariprofundaceae bacterium]